MNFGVSAFAWTRTFAKRHLDILPKVRQLGFDTLEVPMFAPSELPIEAMRRAFVANDLTCTICAILPPGIHPISPDAEVRRRSREHLVACVETAAELGAHLLGGPLIAPIGYLPEHRPTPDEWRWCGEVFQSLRETLQQHEMTLAIEPVNRAETFFVRTASDAMRFCDLVADPRIGVTIDTFHANIEEKSTTGAIHLLGSRLKHMHLSENDRGLLGTGQVDFPGILKALTAIGYSGCLMIEGFGYSQGEPDAPGALWASESVSPEDLASKGLAYLHEISGSSR